MSSKIISALPSTPLSSDIVSKLDDSEEFEQVVSVRGYYTNSGPVTFQLLLNLRQERLLALHFDEEQESWIVAFDSDDLEKPEEKGSDDNGHSLYEQSHKQLEQLSPDDMEMKYGSYFENTLSDKEAEEDMSMIPGGMPDGIVTSEDIDR